jgi:hypothetical protein
MLLPLPGVPSRLGRQMKFGCKRFSIPVHLPDKGNPMFASPLTEEEKIRRRQLTDYAIKLTLLAAGIGLVLELVFYLFIFTPEHSTKYR